MRAFVYRACACAIGVSACALMGGTGQIGETAAEAARLQPGPGEREVPAGEGVEAVDGVPPGYTIIEGDIIVPLDFVRRRATFGDATFWPGGVVPYTFDANVTPQNQVRALNAMAEITAVASVTFRPRNGGDPDWIHIRDWTGNSSPVGVQGGAQNLNIASWGFRFIIVHELYHALGFWHEQSRPDRDAWVQINAGNIQDGRAHNFNIRGAADVYGPYDFDSVMHYDACAFSNCCPPLCDCPAGCETITVLPPNEEWQGLIGQRDHLSTMDGRTMSFIYAAPDWRFVDRGHPTFGSGTFADPWQQFTTGAQNVPTGGVLWIEPGTYSAVGTYLRAMTIQAPQGGVILGE